MSDTWNLSDPDERHLAAGEYVLGVLSRGQRAEFEALMAVSHELQTDVERWREHVQLFNQQLGAVTPPRGVWPRIRRDLGLAPSSPWRSLGLWRGVTGVLAAAVVAIALWVPVDAPRAPTDAVYVVQDENRVPGWIISASQDGQLYVQAVQPSQVGEGQTGELWLIADGTPVSLGLLPSRGEHTLVPQQDLVARLQTADLAVSIEPAGGAPQGQPTGPVIDHGRLTPVRHRL